MSAHALERLRALAARCRRADRDARRPRRRTGRRRRRREPCADRGAGPRAEGRREDTSCSSRRSTRATCCTTAPACRARPGGRPQAAGRRPAVRARARPPGRAGRHARGAELADVITLSALAQGAGRQALAEAVWAAGARASAGDPAKPTGAPRSSCSRGLPRRSRRCAQARPTPPPRTDSRLDIVCRPWQTGAQSRNRNTRSTVVFRAPSRGRPSRAAGSWAAQRTAPERSPRPRSRCPRSASRSGRSSRATNITGRRLAPRASSRRPTTSRPW